MEFQGEKLKKIRQEKGLSLEEAHKKTKINLNILKAIEGDTITNLSPIYLKGFLKIYCEFLGVNPKEYITDYKETPDTADQIKQAPLLKPLKLKLGTLKFIQKIKAIVILILVIVVSSALLFNLGKFISSRQKENLAKKGLTPSEAQRRAKIKTQKTQQVKASVTTTRQTPAGSIPKSTNSGIRLGIRASENCWIQVKVDGRLVFQRVLERGRFESWQAKDRIELSLGNAGAVELEVNGQIFSNLGRRGEVRKSIMITKEGLNIGK
jgi:cytoskeletal protein RodZ